VISVVHTNLVIYRRPGAVALSDTSQVGHD